MKCWSRLGVRDALSAGVAAFEHLVEDFKKQYVAIAVATAIGRAIVGKSGENIKRLRTGTAVVNGGLPACCCTQL